METLALLPLYRELPSEDSNADSDPTKNDAPILPSPGKSSQSDSGSGLSNNDAKPKDVLQALDRIARLLEAQAAQRPSRPDNKDNDGLAKFKNRVNRNIGYGAYAVFISTIAMSVLSFARDTFEAEGAKFKESDSNTTYASLYVTIILSVGAAATSIMDAAKIMDSINAQDFQSGRYAAANFDFRLNHALLGASQIIFIIGLSNFIAITQTLVVKLAVQITFIVLSIIAVVSLLLSIAILRRFGNAISKRLGLAKVISRSRRG